MSDLPVDDRDSLDLRTVLAEIDRKRAETQKLQGESDKFVAEQRKLIAEDRKLDAEQRKLIAESRKLDRDRWLAPFVIMTSLAVSLSTGLVVAILAHYWK